LKQRLNAVEQPRPGGGCDLCLLRSDVQEVGFS